MSFLIASVFILLAALHFYWAAGGQVATVAVIPHREGRPLFEPGRAASAVVGLLLMAAAVVVFTGATWLCCALAAVMFLRAVGEFRYVGFFKSVRNSRFAELDTLYYSPLCLALAAGTAWVALK